jgi:phosphopantetheinyl transferase
MPTTPPAWMGESERVRWAQLKPGARVAFAACRALVRELLESATGVAAPDWTVSADTGRAPLAGTPALAAEAVRVSLSHRLGWVAAAVSESAVGIDVEVARSSRSETVDRAAMMLAPAELADWKSLASERREPALLTAWTAKEAWFKASPAGAAAWDFRQVVAHACAPAQANVRAWEASPLHVAVCSGDAGDLADAVCLGLDATATSSFWRVVRA